MKVLIIGNGAKELALAQSLMEKGSHDVLIAPGNPGVQNYAQAIGSDLKKLDVNDILKTAANFKPDWILICDEGFARSKAKKALEQKGYRVFAPSEASADRVYKKDKWTRYFKDHNLKAADNAIAANYDEAAAMIQENEGPWVLTKLTDPSFFKFAYLEEEAYDILSEWFASDPAPVLVSEYIDGPRFYMSCLVDGSNVIPMQTSMIRRGIYEQEDDPETKGMGAVSPASMISADARQKALDEIIYPYLEGLEREGTPYRGFLAGEFVQADDGPYCVNLKCGLSDCASILTFLRLNEDLIPVIEGLEKGEIRELKWLDKPAVSIVMASSGYPDKPSVGHVIKLDEDFEGSFYPHRIKMERGKMVTDGGRIGFVCASGNTVKEAADNALEAAGHIVCDDIFYRTDIGQIDGESSES